MRKQVGLLRLWHTVLWNAAFAAGIPSLAGCGMMEPVHTSGAMGNLPFRLHGITGSTSNLTLHPFGSSLSSRGLSLFAGGQITFTDAIQSLVGDQLGNGVQVQLSRAQLSDALAAGGQRYDATFLVNNVPIFGTAMAAHLLNDGSPFVLGTLPSVSAAAVTNAALVWPDLDVTKTVVLRSLTIPGGSTVALYSPQRVYLPATPDELRPTWKMTAKINNLPYDVLADENGLLSFTKRYYEVSGSATVYPNNVLDAATVSYALQDLAGDGTLTSNYLQTFIPTGYTRAIATNETFNYQPSDGRFPEVNAYSHTDEHFRWLIGLGGQTYGDLPIHLELHQVINGTVDNALFIPGDADAGEPFQIQIGDGDGTNLANLPTDWDVPSHESGHYFVYNYLKATTGESLGVHEGMADLLVYLQKGIKGRPQPACLGPSICPAGTEMCIEPGCLRTDDNSWAYNDTNWQLWTEQLGGVCCGHKHGQVIGGVVWDLVKNNVLSAAQASSLTLTAISYFKADSGIRDYLLALLIADKTLFNCQFDTQLHNYMKVRALNTLIPDAQPGCSNIPQLVGTGNDGLVGSTNNTTTTTTSSKGSGLLGTGCGTVGAGSGVQPWLIALIGLLPLLATFAPQAAKVRSRSRQKPKREV